MTEISSGRQSGAEVRLDSELSALVGRMAEGDEQALARFYDLTHGKAYAVALRIMRNAESAEDVLEDAYWQAWRDASRYDATRGRAAAWLLTICRSRALDALRRREPAESVEDIDSVRADHPADDGDPCGLLDSMQRDSALRAAIEQLKPQARQLIAFAFFRGLSHQEIADTCGLPLGTVKTTLFRAYRQLKDCLSGQGWEPDYE